jgi:glycosylphosphatidylinositol transamidase
VIVAAWRNMEGVLNRSGVALLLTLARYFKSTCLPTSSGLVLIMDRMVFVVKGHYLRDTPG